ncbi:hypothetical protein AALP_AAs73343U000100 [Arabis alpina]|uniref:Uncharacterized protein n=1 Tax=Arabis alpina TaxID=50452 RepID=A0A087FW70_ARAAL|nr:hypothetical protein AALP_AAs73343U000100 [Arabis alpina]
MGGEASRLVPLRSTPMRSSGDEAPTRGGVTDVLSLGVRGEDALRIGGTIPLNDKDPELPPGRADASYSSSSFDSQVSSDKSDDEGMFIEVEQTRKAKKVKKKAKVNSRPDPSGSFLSNVKSLKRLRKKCGISEEIVLVASTLADRADAPPSGYMTLFENYFDQCMLWFL